MVDEQTVIENAAAAALKYGSGAAVSSAAIRYFGLSAAEWTLVFGAIGASVALVGLAVTWYYQFRRNQREERLMEGPFPDGED